MTKLRKKPSLNDLYTCLYLGFVFGFSNSGRQNGRVVMPREFGITRVYIRIVITRPGDARLEIVRNDGTRNTAEKLKGFDM